MVLAKASRDAFTPRLPAIGVPLPLMPVGEESVPLPLMPVGVEHFIIAATLERLKVVPLPLMPVGVEHGLLLLSGAVV